MENVIFGGIATIIIAAIVAPIKLWYSDPKFGDEYFGKISDIFWKLFVLLSTAYLSYSWGVEGMELFLSSQQIEITQEQAESIRYYKLFSYISYLAMFSIFYAGYMLFMYQICITRFHQQEREKERKHDYQNPS